MHLKWSQELHMSHAIHFWLLLHGLPHAEQGNLTAIFASPYNNSEIMQLTFNHHHLKMLGKILQHQLIQHGDQQETVHQVHASNINIKLKHTIAVSNKT